MNLPLRCRALFTTNISTVYKGAEGVGFAFFFLSFFSKGAHLILQRSSTSAVPLQTPHNPNSPSPAPFLHHQAHSHK